MQVETAIDMVRIGFKNDAEEFMKLIQEYQDTYFILRKEDDRYMEKNGYFDYRHLWVFGADESSVSVGYGLNSMHEKKNKGFIEWNPNKVCIKLQGKLSEFIRLLLKFSSWHMTRCDIANDILDIDMKNCFPDRMRKRGFHSFTGDNSSTWYFGERGRTGQIKIYDKKQEEKEKKNVDTRSRIRYETTYKADIFHIQEKAQKVVYGDLEPVAYPELVIVNGKSEMKIEDKAMLKLLLTEPESMEFLSKYQKKKYKGANSAIVYTPSYSTDNACAHYWYKCFVEWIYPEFHVHDKELPV